MYAGENPGSLSFSWINTPGVMIFIAAIIGGLIQGASFGTMGKVLIETLKKYWKTILTICCVMATAKIMGYSGMISDIAAALVVVAGPFYPLISPLVGALGAFVTEMCIRDSRYRDDRRLCILHRRHFLFLRQSSAR